MARAHNLLGINITLKDLLQKQVQKYRWYFPFSKLERFHLPLPIPSTSLAPQSTAKALRSKAREQTLLLPRDEVL